MSLKKSGIQLSATQVAASVLAAVTATVAGSFLGVNGTIIGAAVASVITVVGNAFYSHSILRTRQRVLTAPAARRIAPLAGRVPAPVPRAATPSERSPSRNALRRGGFAVVGTFVVLLALLTTVEVVSGRPLTDLLHGRPASGTTVFGSAQQLVRTTPAQPAPVTVTQTVIPTVVTTTPTVTQTAPALTVTPSPTATATAPATPAPTPTATSTP